MDTTEAYPTNDKPVELTTMLPALKSLPAKLRDIQLNDFLFRGSLGPGSRSQLLVRGDTTIFGLRVIVEAKIGHDGGKGVVVKGMLPTQDQEQMKGVGIVG